MDYQRVYNYFIASRRLMERNLIVYEVHHITPRCLCGGNEPENLIRLSLGDHLFAHILLAKIHGGDLLLAAILMLDHKKHAGRRSRNSYRDMRLKHREYLRERAEKQWEDEQFAEERSQQAHRQWGDPIVRAKMIEGMKNGCMGPVGVQKTQEHKNRLRDSWTPERRAAQSIITTQMNDQRRALKAKTKSP